MQADIIQSKALKEGAVVTVHRHYYILILSLVLIQDYSYSLHNIESWKRPNLLCIGR